MYGSRIETSSVYDFKQRTRIVMSCYKLYRRAYYKLFIPVSSTSFVLLTNLLTPTKKPLNKTGMVFIKKWVI